MRVYVLLTLIVTGVTFSPAAAAQSIASAEPSITADHPERRVRTRDPRVQDAMAEGTARSAAFRDVLRRVESRDVIVYVEMQPRLRGLLAGQMKWVAATQHARYVRVELNPDLARPQLIATLAHELEHVAEVGEAPTVVNENTLAAFYRVVGSERRADSGAWDTEAAQLTGDVVRKELTAASLLVARESILLSRTSAGRQ